MTQIEVHLVASAHLDPVWLWPWQIGLDEVLATCRSACDRLDAHLDLVFTRGEAWVYRQIELVDQALFARIRAHIEAGRWEIIGGWWVQPDCNLPSGFGLQKQIELGRDYFLSRFERFPDVAYNMDSFGHTASLPSILQANGQRFYVMMRPQEWEMKLPARLFRWRGHEGGPEVVTFRIGGGYAVHEMSLGHVEKSLSELPPGLTHTMCFIGVGNHGGGPTEEQIAWCREHENAIPGARLFFSSPALFFAAIEDQIKTLPLVTGELQQHAIGCYSVYRSIKTATRRAENLLLQAQTAVPEADLVSAWEKVCFAHFHDTIAGTSIDAAYPQQLDALGFAATVADETLQLDFRRRLNVLPADQRQRIVAFNAMHTPFVGHLEFEPWLDWQDWDDSYWLSDSNGSPVPYQRTYSDSMVFQIRTLNTAKYGFPHLVFPAVIGAGELAVWHVERGPAPTFFAPAFEAHLDFATQTLRLGEVLRPFPQLALIEDKTDTWSHNYSDSLHQSYAEDALEIARFEAPQILDDGPVFRAWRQVTVIGNSRLEAEWRVYAGDVFVELRLRVHWLERHRLLKLVWPQQGALTRTDGIAGGQLERINDGRELPLRDWTKSGADAVVCPAVFALDATPQRLRLTLLRSPLVAHHEPHEGTSPRARVADQGAHEFLFRFFAGDVAPETLEGHAQNVQTQPLLADLTRGMKAH